MSSRILGISYFSRKIFTIRGGCVIYVYVKFLQKRPCFTTAYRL
jgi:hypothetical protein